MWFDNYILDIGSLNIGRNLPIDYRDVERTPQMTNPQIIAEIEEYAKDITRLLAQIAVLGEAIESTDSAIIEQARNLSLSDFNTWQTTRLKRLKNIIEGNNSKPDKAKEGTR